MEQDNAKIKYPLETGIEGARTEDTVYITSHAINQIKNIVVEQNVPEEYYLRIGTQSGGCSGMQHVLGFDNTPADESLDKSFSIGDSSIVIDRKSLFLLQGITIDYIEDIDRKGFVFHNPYHQGCGGCGCH